MKEIKKSARETILEEKKPRFFAELGYPFDQIGKLRIITSSSLPVDFAIMQVCKDAIIRVPESVLEPVGSIEVNLFLESDQNTERSRKPINSFLNSSTVYMGIKDDFETRIRSEQPYRITSTVFATRSFGDFPKTVIRETGEEVKYLYPWCYGTTGIFNPDSSGRISPVKTLEIFYQMIDTALKETKNPLQEIGSLLSDLQYQLGIAIQTRRRYDKKG